MISLKQRVDALGEEALEESRRQARLASEQKSEADEARTKRAKAKKEKEDAIKASASYKLAVEESTSDRFMANIVYLRELFPQAGKAAIETSQGFYMETGLIISVVFHIGTNLKVKSEPKDELTTVNHYLGKEIRICFGIADESAEVDYSVNTWWEEVSQDDFAPFRVSQSASLTFTSLDELWELVAQAVNNHFNSL